MKTKNQTKTIEPTTPSNIAVVPGIPIPPTQWVRTKYPWRSMRSGDSFFIPGDRRLVVTKTCKNSIGFTPISRKVVEGNVAGFRYWRP